MKVGLCSCKNNTNYNVYKLARIAIMSFRTSEYLDKTLSKYILLAFNQFYAQGDIKIYTLIIFESLFVQYIAITMYTLESYKDNLLTNNLSHSNTELLDIFIHYDANSSEIKQSISDCHTQGNGAKSLIFHIKFSDLKVKSGLKYI